MSFEALPLPALLGIFALAAGLVTLCGVRLTGAADRLADRTGLGEALIGGVLLGATTSLSGVTVSVTAALDGRASLAFANSVGGIAAQTAFLAMADLAYRRVNLEHAAADLANLFQAALLCLMLSLPVLAFTGPEMAVLGVHPVTLVLPVVYVLGVRATVAVRADPMWRPVRTSETRPDEPDEPEAETNGALVPLVLRVAALGLVLALTGWAISRTGAALAERTGISETAVGALMTAVATSLPELVTTLAAARRGAVQLAVGGIIGGNAFDVLFLSAADIAYADGAFYGALAPGDLFWLALGLAMTAVLLMGLVLRQRAGPARIGFESVALLGLYGLGIGAQILSG